MNRIPSKGETVKLACDTCHRLFEFTGDGDGWIPTTCPKCKDAPRRERPEFPFGEFDNGLHWQGQE